MNSQPTDNIFNSSSSLTAKEIEQYFSGNLSEIEERIIEKKMAADDFNAEASEGFEKHPEAFADINQLNEEINKKIYNGFNTTLGFSILSASLLFFTLIIWQNSTSYKSEEPRPRLSKRDNLKGIEKIIPAEIENDTRQITSEEVITQQKAIADINKEKATFPTATSPTTEEKEYLLIPHSVEARYLSKTPVPEINKKIQKPPFLNMIYLSDLKVYDYSKVYKNKFPASEYNLSGLAAIKENEGKELPDAALKTAFIPYKDFLAGAMKKFSMNKYKEAASNFRQVLKHFPDDVNANFYIGLCYYNLQEPSTAITHFNAVLKNPIMLFDEEAQYFKALSFIEDGQKNKGVNILKEIVDKDNYYKIKAANQLKKLGV